MSASDKKKLRKEQESAIITERQRKEQKEAKKLKIYTITFISAMVLVVLIAAASLIIRGVTQSGVFERNTLAVAIDDVRLNTVDFNYYYNDAINEMYNKAYEQYSTYFELYFDSLGLDITKPLNEQKREGDEDGRTWADYFVDTALENAKSDIIMEKLAKEANFTLSEEQREELQTELANIETNAKLYGYGDAEQYLQIVYGYGSDMESYEAYRQRCELAEAFYIDYYEQLDYTDTEIRDYEKTKPNNYNSYTYHYAYLSYTEFREGGTKDEDGNTTYTEEEDIAAKEALKKAAEELGTAKTLEELEAKVKEAPVNASSSTALNKATDTLHTSISSAVLSDWLAEADRKEGDIAVLGNFAVDAKEDDLANGYYAVYFVSRKDNKTPVGNVRHLLVKFEGGTEDEETGETVYSDEEKAAAKAEADKYLKQWLEDGEPTEERFIELVKAHSDDTSAEDGGLFEDITPASNYVPNFLNWSIDAGRKVGDAEVIETEYGYHVMYYVGASELNYRDYMISQEMKTEQQTKWYEEQLKDVKTSKLDLSYVDLDMTISNV